jgi:hypothetical protein
VQLPARPHGRRATLRRSHRSRLTLLGVTGTRQAKFFAASVGHVALPVRSASRSASRSYQRCPLSSAVPLAVLQPKSCSSRAALPYRRRERYAPRGHSAQQPVREPELRVESSGVQKVARSRRDAASLSTHFSVRRCWPQLVGLLWSPLQWMKVEVASRSEVLSSHPVATLVAPIRTAESWRVLP